MVYYKDPRHGPLISPGFTVIDDHAAEFRTPEFLAVAGIERIEVAANTAEEHDASGVGVIPPRIG
jgi:hypothetical protein